MNNSIEALTNKEYKDKLIPYHHIFLHPLKNKKDLERISNELDMATKTEHTFKKMLLYSRIPILNPSREELDDAKNFLELISDRCLILGNSEFSTQQYL